MLYRAATRLELDAPRTWELGNAGVNRLLYSAEGFSLVGWNDRMHLESVAAKPLAGPCGGRCSVGQRHFAPVQAAQPAPRVTKSPGGTSDPPVSLPVIRKSLTAHLAVAEEASRR